MGAAGEDREADRVEAPSVEPERVSRGRTSVKSPGGNSRQEILEAAIRVAQRDGMLAMTLDHVAAEAGVSKGGLMYHFKSKDELLQGLISYFGQAVQRTLNDHVAADRQADNRWLRALLAIADPQTPEEALPFERDVPATMKSKFCTSLMAAAAINPSLLSPLRDLGTRLRDQMRDEAGGSLEPLLIWLALDGLFMWELFGLMTPDDPLRRQLLNVLRSRAQPRAEVVP